MAEALIGGGDSAAENTGTTDAAKTADAGATDTAAAGAAKTDGDAAAAAAAKSDEGKDGKDGAADKKAEGAPEAYEAFKMPEGVEVDNAALEAAQPLFKELNLPQEKAQKLVDFYANVVKEAGEKSQAAWQSHIEGWVDEAKKDKEIGGDKFNESVSDATLFAKEFGTPELLRLLTATGVGNNAEFIRAFAKAGKLVREDKLKFGGAPSGGPKTAAEALYPNQGKA